MSSAFTAFIAVLFLTWPVAETHPAHELLLRPAHTGLSIEVMGFASEADCEAFIAAAREGGAENLLPVAQGLRLDDASCRPL